MTHRFADRFDPVRIFAPFEPPAPVVFDSPHSGTVYPTDFAMACPLASLRHAEDTFVDELFAAAPAAGAAFICAQFPRSYIDVNRALEDIDPDLIDGTWPGPVAPSEKTRLGKGLVWRLLNTGETIYAHRLPVAEVERRISVYYRPYHAALDAALDRVQDAAGIAYHINCHSMPARVRTAAYPDGVDAADFVLGDRDGTSCEPGLTDLVARTLAGFGYTVARNDPYKGVELVRRHGRPAEGRHSLQIEVNRRLYLTPALGRAKRFQAVRRDLERLVADICAYAQARAEETAEDGAG